MSNQRPGMRLHGSMADYLEDVFTRDCEMMPETERERGDDPDVDMEDETEEGSRLYHVVFDSPTSPGRRVNGPNPTMTGLCDGIYGDCSALMGDCSGLCGYVTGIIGYVPVGCSVNLDSLKLTGDEREQGITVNEALRRRDAITRLSLYEVVLRDYRARIKNAMEPQFAVSTSDPYESVAMMKGRWWLRSHAVQKIGKIVLSMSIVDAQFDIRAERVASLITRTIQVLSSERAYLQDVRVGKMNVPFDDRAVAPFLIAEIDVALHSLSEILQRYPEKEGVVYRASVVYHPGRVSSENSDWDFVQWMNERWEVAAFSDYKRWMSDYHPFPEFDVSASTYHQSLSDHLYDLRRARSNMEWAACFEHLWEMYLDASHLEWDEEWRRLVDAFKAYLQVVFDVQSARVFGLATGEFSVNFNVCNIDGGEGFDAYLHMKFPTADGKSGDSNITVRNPDELIRLFEALREAPAYWTAKDERPTEWQGDIHAKWRVLEEVISSCA